MLRTLRAYGAHKGSSVAVFADEACKHSNTRQKMAGEAGQHAGKGRMGKPWSYSGKLFRPTLF